jgi:predicted HicB family RNase H-like nuclease
MNTMMHKGFAARVEYSKEDGCFVGHVAAIRDVIGFHGERIAKLRKAFREAVDDYLATCEKLGQEPNRPCSGQFRLRLAPDLPARAAMAAESQGKSLNTWAADVIENAARR